MHRTPSRISELARLFGALGIVTSLGVGAAPACVDTQSDYDSYLHRTDTLRGSVVTCSFTSHTDGVDPTGTWFMSCLPLLFASQPEVSLLSLVQIDKNSDGTLNFTSSPFNKTKSTFELSSLAADSAPYGQKNIARQSDGSFVAACGNVTVKGDAERILDSDFVISNLTLTVLPQVNATGDKAKDRMIAQLDAELVAPQTKSIHGAGNYCVLERLALQTPPLPMPTFTTSQGATAIGFDGNAYSCTP